ncbi:MAG: KamA family radical SAM protein [Pseudobdellovibrionaceae bacterium]
MKFRFLFNYPNENIQPENWNSWSWQLRHSLKTKIQYNDFFLQKNLPLQPDEVKAFDQGEKIFQIRTTPYYAQLVKSLNDPIRKIIMPAEQELVLENTSQAQHMLDPLGEKKNQTAPRIIHRYSDRALFLVTDFCSVYCRYCTRKHFTAQDEVFPNKIDYEASLNYLRKKTGIREVILSGGDPLTLSNEQIDRVLFDLRKIEHIEIIRIGTRMPVVCPMRIDEGLLKIIKKNKPVFMMTHFNHPRELTEQAAMALENTVDHGIPVMNQMVLLNGVNNHAAIVQALSRRLLYLRVKPYYMFQCDPSEGTNHLRTSIDESESIQRELWGHLSGLAMPNLSVDIPNGGGKAYLTPKFETFKSEFKRSYQGWDGVKADYINPSVAQSMLPSDYEDYAKEWLEIKNSKY